jgi:O-antigen ligase
MAKRLDINLSNRQTFYKYLSLVTDLGIVGLFWFAALAFGGNEFWTIGLITVIALLLFAARLLVDCWQGQIKVKANGLYIVLILFLALVAIQALVWRNELPPGNQQTPHTVERYSTLSYLLIAASCASVVVAIQMGFRSRDAIKKLMIGVIGLGFFEAVYGLIQYLGNIDYIWTYSKKAYLGIATGTLINRNHYALLLNIAICVGVGYVYYRSQRLLRGRKLSIRNILTMPDFARLGWIIALLVLMGLGVVFSMSRMGIVTMFCAVGLMIFCANPTRTGRPGLAFGVLLLVAILGLAIYIGVDPVLVRYENISQERSSENDRIGLWIEAWQMVQKNIIFGTGLGTFQWTFPAYERVDPDIPAKYAHNDYLQALAEVGIVGLVLILCGLFLIGRAAVQNVRYSKDPLVSGIGLAAIGALTAVVLQEVTDFGMCIPAVALLFSVVVGLNLRVSLLRHGTVNPA